MSPLASYSRHYQHRRVHVTKIRSTTSAKATKPADAPPPRLRARPPTDEFCFGLPGNTAPFGDFDPAGLTEGKDVNSIYRYREAELTHGRVAMVASVGFPFAERLHPLDFGGTVTGPAINQFQQTPVAFQGGLLVVIAAIELGRANTGWVSPNAGEGIFKLREDYIPGDIGWDPLGLKPDQPQALDERQTRELNNGRLAMFAILGEIAQELVTGKTLFLAD